MVPSRAGTLRWNGAPAPHRAGTVYLDEPGTKVELAYGRFGTALVVDDGSQRVALHGDHAMLAPLADALQERVDGADTTDEEVERAAAWTRRLRSRVAEGRSPETQEETASWTLLQKEWPRGFHNTVVRSQRKLGRG